MKGPAREPQTAPCSPCNRDTRTEGVGENGRGRLRAMNMHTHIALDMQEQIHVERAHGAVGVLLLRLEVLEGEARAVVAPVALQDGEGQQLHAVAGEVVGLPQQLLLPICPPPRAASAAATHACEERRPASPPTSPAVACCPVHQSQVVRVHNGSGLDGVVLVPVPVPLLGPQDPRTGV